ncbi:hypothetical protein GCM10023231_06200 [Olivibacter ginsenosidimutans]|uniref:Streptomycin biosynthesis protein StrF domain-containing protein n=1 Tax=Olivibacter ginsenosidimutans TaxID=1176537 RepID=A0ABP9AHY1_9SPHI
MLSIIISSASNALLSQIKENIQRTVGIPYEIIIFKNSTGLKGICELYNTGAIQAKYDILCFMHEDILFETLNWGQKVINIFKKNSNIGLLGVAGSTYKSLTPSSWAPPFAFDKTPWRINIKQSFKRKDCPEKYDYENPENKEIERVACIDGVWMCSRKEIILEHRFDEDLLKGFHGYDIDISLTIHQKYAVCVTYEVLLKHFSEGNFENNWLMEIIKVHKKWLANLPINVEESIENGPLDLQEQEALHHFILAIIPKSLLPVPLSVGYIHKLFLLKKIPFSIYVKSIKRIVKQKLIKTISNR